jgi:hypothetical protein
VDTEKDEPLNRRVWIVLLGHGHGTTMEEAGSPQGEPYLTQEPEEPETP